MAALLVELEEEFGAGKIYRPYRDVRFSRDKAPYKTAIGASLAGGGYVQISSAGLGAGSGMYMMAPDQLERYRAAVAADAAGTALVAVIAALEKKGVDVSGHDSLKTAPKGYPKDHARIELLRYKGLVGFLRACDPMNSWLAEHVGASTLGGG